MSEARKLKIQNFLAGILDDDVETFYRWMKMFMQEGGFKCLETTAQMRNVRKDQGIDP